MTLRSCALLTLLLVLLAPRAWGQDAHAVTPADSVLEGTVRDAETLAPLGGAVVSAGGRRARSWAVTDESGTYRIVIGRERPLRITVERYGYAPLRTEAALLDPAVRLDFVLTPEPVPLAPLTVHGTRASPMLASLMQPLLRVSGASDGVMETSMERDRFAPFAPVLQVLEAAGQTGGGGGTEPAGGGGVASLGVRGYLTRQGATFVDGAPAVLGESVSFLADPFSSTAPPYRLHVWDAGAPARVTGGLEYVAELEQLARLSEPGLVWRGNVDMVRSSAAVAWRRRGVDAEASGYTTTPWTSSVVGENGHRTRMANVVVWATPRTGERLVATGSLRHESLPAGPGPQASAAILNDDIASLRWDAEAAGGVLEARAGVGDSQTSLPSALSYPGKAPAFLLREARSYLGLEYRRPIARTLGLDFGVDRLGFRWQGSVSKAVATWGFYGEMAYTPRARLGLRLGTRLDQDPAERRLHPAPRVELDWRAGHGIEASVGSGVYHQVLLDPGSQGASGTERALLATGVHYQAGATVTCGRLGLNVRTYFKQLTGSAGVSGALTVWGIGLGVDAPTGIDGGFSGAATVERRREAGSTSWSPLVSLQLDEPLMAGIHLQLRVAANRSAGALIFGGTTADSLRVSEGGSLAGLHAWSLQSDAELSRTIRWTPAGHALRVYAQVLNALGSEFRPLFVEGADARDPYLPRVVVLGLGIGSGPFPMSRWRSLVR